MPVRTRTGMFSRLFLTATVQDALPRSFLSSLSVFVLCSAALLPSFLRVRNRVNGRLASPGFCALLAERENFFILFSFPRMLRNRGRCGWQGRQDEWGERGRLHDGAASMRAAYSSFPTSLLPLPVASFITIPRSAFPF